MARRRSTRRRTQYHSRRRLQIALLSLVVLCGLTLMGYTIHELFQPWGLPSASVQSVQLSGDNTTQNSSQNLTQASQEITSQNASEPSQQSSSDNPQRNSQPDSQLNAQRQSSRRNPLVSFQSNCGSKTSGPADNPIKTSLASWTQEIRWRCVYNIEDFPGNNLINRFNAARDAAAQAGGGVVYFPAGIYNFPDSIQLKSGVIIRGATPQVTDAKSSNFDPPTQLVFPQYRPQLSGQGTPNSTAFKQITTQAPGKDQNIGLVNLAINRAAISFLENVNKTQGRNILVFGVRSNNVALPDPQVPDTAFQHPWQRYSYRFAANIEVAGFENILIANNRINDAITDNFEQPGYRLKTADRKSVVTFEDGKKALFHYGNHYGIVVNRHSEGEGFKLAATPETEPGLFRSGVVVQDNWVYHTMRVAIQASGKGLVIQNNQIVDQPNKQWWIHPAGKKLATGAVTLENRAIDWSGWDVSVIGNQYEVYRHRIGETKYLSVDGEGILIQECCGGTTVRGVKIQNNRGNGYIGLYKVRDIKDATISDNQLRGADILVLADTNNKPYTMNNVQVKNNTVDGNIIARASQGGQGNVIQNNTGSSSSKIEQTCETQVQINNNQSFDLEACSN
ncbi:MAG: hypothetical protein ACFBSC_19775 [Microcoleaceae cyanobacterium]